MNNNKLEILVTAKDSASSVLRGVGESVGQMQSSMQRAVTGSAAVAAGLAAVGAAAGALGVSALKGAGEFEQSRVAFETMLGSADKAAKLMGDIAQFAKATPFELPEIVAGSKQLLAFGFAQEQIIPTMRKLGDLAAGLGVPVGQLAYTFGQVKVAGRLMGEDLMQFTNAGVPLLEELSKVLNVSKGDVKKLVEEGKVGFEDVEKALNNLTGTGSKFGGMMDKQSKTLGGVMSNIKDSFNAALRSMVGVTDAGDIIAGGFFDKVKQAAERLLPTLAKLPETMKGIFSFIGENAPIIAGVLIGALIPAFGALGVSIWASLAPLLPFIAAGAALGAAIKFVVDRLGGWGAVMDEIRPRLVTVWQAVQYAVDALRPSFELLIGVVQNELLPTLQRVWNIVEPYVIPTLKVLGAIVGVYLVGSIYIAINVISLIIAALSAWINIVIEAYKWIINFVTGVVQYIQFCYNQWQANFTAMGNIVNYLVATVSAYFEQLKATIYNALVSIGLAIINNFNWARNTAISIMNGLVGWFYNLPNVISGAVGSIGGRLLSPFQWALDQIRNVYNQIVGIINNVMGKLNAVTDKISSIRMPNIKIPGFAGGVRNFGGGLAVVGERGAELVNLPKGSDVYTNRESRNLLSNAGAGGGAHIEIHGNVINQTPEAAHAFFDRLNRQAELAGQGLAI